MKTAVFVLAAALSGSAARAASVSGTSGNVALPLAMMIGVHDPDLAPGDKKALLDLVEGQTAFAWPKGHPIAVRAEVVICKASNVDITAHSCEISFGPKKLTIQGRPAHELFATIGEAGVESEGATGSIYEAISHVRCTIDPRQITEKSGAGAECKFTPGPQ